MNLSRKTIAIAGAATLAAAGAGAGLAIAGSDEAVKGPEADRAGAAAVKHTGGGRVLGVEREDDGRAGYEVEVRQADGRVMEVDVDANGAVTGSSLDDDSGGRDDDEGSDDDDDGSAGRLGPLPAKLDPAAFSTTIDNPYWPMRPGSRWVYRAGDERIVVTVTRRTAVINGVRARVVHDRVTEGGRLVEDTEDWYAQDRAGNVVYLGEKTVEVDERGRRSTAGSWRAGSGGAQAGIAMPAHPQPGLRFHQELLRGEAEDTGHVLSLNEQAEVPAGHYRGLLLTKDFTPLERDVLEYKLYAKGVGPVLLLDVSGGSGGRAELVRYER
jgi:hypothetical protein